MGRQLIKRHSVLFDKKVIAPSIFAHNINTYGNVARLVSSIVWDLFHKLQPFPKNKYLTCNNSDGLTSGNERLSDVDLIDQSNHCRINRWREIY